MNDDEAPIEQIEAGSAGAPEGAPVAQPNTDDISKMYEELGIKATVPTGKTKGRPKTSDVRAKDSDKKDSESTKSGRKEADGGKSESKDAPNPSKDGSNGNEVDEKGKKVSEDAGEISKDSKDSSKGVRKPESETDKDIKSDSEGDSDEGDDRARQKSDESDDSEEEGKNDEVKRPGKSNPEVEKRFQKLTAEIKARDELIEKQAKALEETQRKQFEAQTSKEDPEYTVDDFRKVRDEQGNILDLDADQAELAYRRWKDGYDQRKVEREAKFNHEQKTIQARQEASRRLMESSVAAYDTLMDIYDNTPELNEKSSKFDKEFSDLVVPIIKEAIIYQDGTEPGNAENRQPIILGLKMHPKTILSAMNKIRQSKPSLQLNNINDNVESHSNVQVTHSRSSNPTVQAANELYKELGIDKRL